MRNHRFSYSLLALLAATPSVMAPTAHAAGPTPTAVKPGVAPVAAKTGTPPVAANPALATAAKPNEARLMLERDPKKKIQGLKWRREVMVVSPDPRSGHSKPMVRLEGVFPRGERTLFLGRTQINTSPKDGTFDLLIHLKGNSTALVFQTVDKARKVTAERIVVNFPAYPQFVATKSDEPTGVKTSTPFNFGLGVSSISYKETAFKDLSMVAVTAKGAYSKALGVTGRWEMGANLYVTAFPISSNRDGFTFRFLGTNFRIGANLLPKTSMWKMALSTGMYYTTTLVSTPSGKATFGFNNMYGPQLLGVLGRRAGDKGFIGTYVKYAPIMDNFVPTTDSNEIAYGMNFTRRLQSGNAWSLSLDAATLKLNILNQIFITSQSYSLGLSFIW